MNSHNLVIKTLTTYGHTLYEKIKPRLTTEENDTNVTFKEFFSSARMSDIEEIRSAYYAIVYTFHEKLKGCISREHIQVVFDISLYDIREIVEEHEARLGSRMYMYRTYRSLIRDISVPPISIAKRGMNSSSSTNTVMSIYAMQDKNKFLLEKRNQHILEQNAKSITQLFSMRRSSKIKLTGDFSISQIYEKFAEILFLLIHEETGYDKSLIIAKTMKHEFVHCRLIFMALFKEYLPMTSHKIIGSFLGKRDHTTVTWGINTHRDIICSKAITQDSIAYNHLFFAVRTKIRNNPPEFLPEKLISPALDYGIKSEINTVKLPSIVEETMAKNIDTIFNALCAESGFSKEVICSKSRKRELVYCRYVAVTVYLLFYPHACLRQMQELVGFSDHSSVINALQKHEEMAEPINQELDFVKNYWDLHGRVRRRLGFTF